MLIANRGAIAVRVMRSARELGLETALIYAEPDADRAYLKEADATVSLPGTRAQETYLNGRAIIEAAKEVGADSIHPGYGFLSEDADFAEAVREAGLIFVGPSAAAIRASGDKRNAGKALAPHGMPVSPAANLDADDLEGALVAAEEMGFPVLIKPAHGGGGIGMVAARNRDELAAALPQAASLAQRSFGSGSLYMERYLDRPRHIEFQIVSDGRSAIHLHERDCSVQRRFQKVIEECPAPGLSRAVLDEMGARAAKAMLAIGYDQIGTVEMLHDLEAGFVFMEVNARLQVEHAVTEAVTGYDLVATQLRIARGERLGALGFSESSPRGHAIEARLCAEDPYTFFPSSGRLDVFEMPSGEGIRVETGYAAGETVSPFYDSLLAKVIAHAATRSEALSRLSKAIEDIRVVGVKTNASYLRAVLTSDEFEAGKPDTGLGEIIRKRVASA